MRNTLLRCAVSFLAMAVLMSASPLWAQPFYFKAVTNLGPVAYWPLQETNTPAAANVETNLGTLGFLADAYYADSQGTSPVARGITGALAGDTDPAENFTGSANCYLATPAILTNLAQGPFTIEFWAWPANTTFGMPVGKAGYEAQNGGGNPGAGGGSPIGGWTVDWHRSSAVWDMQIFHGGTGTSGATYIYGTAAAASTTGWQHVVFTYDRTNVVFYWNGQSNAALAAAYLPDIWSPLTIGAGRLADNAAGDPGGHRFSGMMDEVALYSNALSADDVLTHYEAGTNTAPATSYETLVLNDKPMVYYRMDALSYSTPASNTFPAVNNYGSASLNGYYPPNTLPGVVAGPDYSGIGSNGVASPIDGLNAAIDGGYAPSLNPPTGQPITATIWARGYPCDTRNQELMSHTDKSWHMFVDQSGKVHWNAGAGGEITSVKVFNDGEWHFLAGVYTGTQNMLYIDGALDSSSSATNSITGSTNDVYLGGAADYTGGTTERFFAGSICQAAFFTNALSSSQIQQLYASGLSAGSAPQIILPPVVYAVSNSVYTYTNLSISGTEPLSIQWYQEGVLIPGATNSGYSFIALSNTMFSVVASNAYGVVTNGPSVVHIVTPPSDTFAQSVLSLGPVAYWPMQETNAPALPDIETNFGSLGAVADAYYADMASPVVVRGVTGALAGDSDPGVSFSGANNCFLATPSIDPRLALTAPFTIELWAWPGNTSFGMPLAKNAFQGLNAGGNVGSGTGNLCGWSVDWARNGTTQWDLQLYDNIPTQAAAIQIFGPASAGSTTGWQHVVFTYDGATVNFYWNGQLAGSGAAPYVPDTWGPLCIGAGRFAQGTPGDQGYRLYNGQEDEIALYTNILSSDDILAHYNAGTNSSPATNYQTLVLKDHPLIYYRMDAPAYTAPASATYPALINYGSASLSGDYPPDTIPGGVGGPSYLGLGGSDVASPISGLNAAVDAGYSPELNPPTGQPITAMIWIKGNPSDPRMQCPMGHSDQSWRFGVDSSGKAHWASGDNGGEITSVKVVNDGIWHFLVGVYTGTENLLYIDGQLDSTTPATGTITGSSDDVYLGGAPDYTATSNERFFAGSICQAAFFTNALTASQVSQLYYASGISPQITQQPISSSANQGAPYTNTVMASGSPPLTYQWYQNNALLAGETGSNLVFNPLNGGDAGNYYAVVSNTYGIATSAVVTLAVIQAPLLVQDITNVTLTNNILLFAGAHPTFSVAAVGQVPLYYAWYTNGAAVSGATSQNYTLPPVQTEGVTNFACVVSNSLGSITSSVVGITLVTDPVAPYPQAVLSADPIGYWRLNEGPDNGAGDAGVIADDYWGGDNGIYTNVIIGQAGYAPQSDPTETSVNFGFLSTVNGDAFHIGGIDFSGSSNAAFSVEAWVNGYPQSLDSGIVAKGYGGGGEQFSLDCGSDGGTPSHAFRFFVRTAGGTAVTANSAVQPGNVWHHLVGVCDEPDGLVALYVDGALSVAASISPGSGVLASTNSMTIGSRPSSAIVTSNDLQFLGSISDVAVYNYALSSSQVSAHYYASGIAPIITTEPPSTVNVDENGSISIPVTVSGTPPLSYIWNNLNTGQPVAGQTNATLTLTDVPLSLNGASFQLGISNLYIQPGNPTLSSPVYLNVISGAPQATPPMLPPTVYAYSNRMYTYSSLAVTGTEPFSYQWFIDGNTIPGATNSTYSFLALSNATYTVVVSNVYGSITSGPSAVIPIVPPTDSFGQSVLSLGPVAYWPMQETNAPALPDIETNFGSLGAVADAYYADMASPVVVRGVTGALAGDSDPGVSFSGANNCFLATPSIDPRLALTAPFTIELWAWPGNTSFGMPLAKNAFQGLNAGGNVGSGTGNLCGWSVDWARNGTTQWDLQLYDNIPTQAAAIQIFGPASAGSTTGWQHVVFTYDGATVNFYWNGQLAGSGAAPYVPDTWGPLCIGAGRFAQGTPGDQGYRLYNGQEDEIALYTNILSSDDILAHYNAGTNSSPATNYQTLVLKDHPLIYYRMDAPAYTAPASATYPALINYGSASLSGDYPPDTIPGGVGGPSYLGLGGSDVASPISGLNAAVDAGYSPELNPPTGQPITAMIWIKGNPSDPRMQCPMGHSDQSWRFGVDSSGKAHWASGDNGGEITSVKVVNDGIWHFLVGVYTGTENLLYIDGQLDSTTPATGTITGSSDDVYLGGAPDYTATSNERFFAGSICQAAFFTNAITPSEIQQLYTTGVNNQVVLSIGKSGANVVLTWSAGTLLSSTNLAEPFTTNAVSGAVSPYIVAPSGTATYFKIRNP